MSTETHISSLVVHVRPDRMDAVRTKILDRGAEIPVEDPDGKIVAVIETGTEAGITSFADEITFLDGVLSANLVFHVIDENDEAVAQAGETR